MTTDFRQHQSLTLVALVLETPKLSACKIRQRPEPLQNMSTRNYDTTSALEKGKANSSKDSSSFVLTNVSDCMTIITTTMMMMMMMMMMTTVASTTVNPMTEIS